MSSGTRVVVRGRELYDQTADPRELINLIDKPEHRCDTDEIAITSQAEVWQRMRG